MKITIILLSLALVAVSSMFFLDHIAQTAKLNNADLAYAQLQEKSNKQSKTASVFINCVNATEKAYQQDKKYVSVVACVKAGVAK